MDIQKFRLDIVGLSTDDLPDATDKLDGSTYYTVDTQELYVCYNGEWYNQTNPESQSDDSEDDSETEPEENNKKEEMR